MRPSDFRKQIVRPKIPRLNGNNIDRRECELADKKNPPPPYQGDDLNMCYARAFDFNVTQAVVVSGDSWNPCGHLMLQVGRVDWSYFHVAGLRSRPKMMNELGFRRYLRENKKRVLSRRAVAITNPEGAQAKLETLMSQRWTWMVLPNNCSSFVEEVVQAGGSSAGLYWNCPAKEGFW